MASIVDKLMDSLNYDLLDIVTNELDYETKQAYKEEAEHIYDEFNPNNPNASRYRSGLEGSFADKDNFISKVDMKGNRFIYNLENHRITDCNCEYCQGQNYRIDYYIENGIAGKYSIPERPVSERVEDRVEMEGIIEMSLRRGFKRKGIKFED